MTTDTPTPRTKGMTGTFYLRCDDCPQPGKCESHKCVHPDDCADIERDLAECRAALRAVVTNANGRRETGCADVPWTTIDEARTILAKGEGK